MPAERIYAHPAVSADNGRVALRRGPLVYCLEHADHDGHRVQDYRLPRQAAIETEMRADLFDGIVTLTAQGLRLEAGDWDEVLYRASPPRAETATLTAIPYYLWNNRGPGTMQVWVPEGL